MTNIAAIAEAVAEGKADAAALVTQALKDGVTANDIITKAIEAGLEVLEDRFKRNEIYMPQILLAKRSVKGCVAVLGDKFTSDLEGRVRSHFDRLQGSCKSCHPIKLWD